MAQVRLRLGQRWPCADTDTGEGVTRAPDCTYLQVNIHASTTLAHRINHLRVTYLFANDVYGTVGGGTQNEANKLYISFQIPDSQTC